jgi:hypothetical protein
LHLISKRCMHITYITFQQRTRRVLRESQHFVILIHDNGQKGGHEVVWKNYKWAWH